jgi:hypothetical protein
MPMQEKLIELVARNLPPLKREKRPVIAVAVAVLFGGFGLALYLRSWLDAAVAAISIVLIDTAINAGFPVGILTILAVLAQYAYTRVEASNRRLGIGAGTVPASGTAQTAP